MDGWESFKPEPRDLLKPVPIECVECGNRLGWADAPPENAPKRVEALCGECKYQHAAGRRGEDD